MATIKLTAAEAADIRHVRAQLALTAHEVAVALSKRAGPPVLDQVADDLVQEAARLRAMSKDVRGPAA